MISLTRLSLGACTPAAQNRNEPMSEREQAAIKIQRAYRNYVAQRELKAPKIIEKFDATGKGYRIHPNGTKEFGRYDQIRNRFLCEYSIASDGAVKFLDPDQLIDSADKSSGEYVYESIIEFEGRLIVLEQIF